jgi:small subunit ribosomal protein S15
MALTTEATAKIVQTYKLGEGDTGSSDVQIALFSARIAYLTEHLKIHKHDCHTRHGLSKLVSKRRRLMTYLKRTDLARYQNLIKQLEIRG